MTDIVELHVWGDCHYLWYMYQLCVCLYYSCNVSLYCILTSTCNISALYNFFCKLTVDNTKLCQILQKRLAYWLTVTVFLKTTNSLDKHKLSSGQEHYEKPLLILLIEW